VKRALPALWVDARPSFELGRLFGEFASQEASGAGLESVEGNAVATETRKNLAFDAAMESVRDAPVRRGSNLVVLNANLADLCNFTRLAISDAKSIEVSPFIQCIYLSERIIERHSLVWTMQVEYLDHSSGAL
jgi:hypothetical protein